MDFINSYLPQMGAVGLMLAGLLIFSKYMFNYIMTQVKENSAENKKLEADFRNYVMEQSRISFEIVSKNTEIYKKLMEFLSSQFTEYIDKKIDETKRMSEALIEFIKEKENK